MIGSPFEARDQLDALDRRREEIAAQNTAAQSAPAPVAAPVVAGGMHAAGGYGTPGTVLKGGAGPDIGKKRKGKDRERWVGHDLRDDPPEAALDAADAEAAKNFRDRGATAGPGGSLIPGELAPEDAQRDYLDSGHAAESPMAEAPRTSPIPAQGRGFPRPIDLSPHPAVGGYPGPLTTALAAHEAMVTMAPPISQGETR